MGAGQFQEWKYDHPEVIFFTCAVGALSRELAF